MDRLTVRETAENGRECIWLADRICVYADSERDKEAYAMAERIARLEDLAEQGRLVELPCKVGDTVYEVQEIRRRIQALEIISIYIGRMGEIFCNWELKDGEGIYKNVAGFGISQLGKTVFLTREEAEAKLAGGNNEDNL